MGGAVAGAAVARARRRVIEQFMRANAVSPDQAIRFETGNFIQRRTFDRMVDAGVLKAAPGGHYLDVPAYEANSRQRRKRAGLIVGAVALAGAAAAALLA